ncbi:MAG: TRAP transporter small permease [Tissierellales bacterium]|nr:TRAP transporter small permease [Tissierellales bacterium]MBN2828208.1 TRAP transporter small permease [Tissierellales bacterium]
MKEINIFGKISKSIDAFVNVLVFIAIVGMIVVISLQIITRVFFDALIWSEELSRYLLVWATFLGASLSYKRGMHIAVTFVVDAFPAKISKIVKLMSILFCMMFFIIGLKYGIDYINMQTFQVSAALRIPMKYVYIVIPASFGIMLVHSVDILIDTIKQDKGCVQS